MPSTDHGYHVANTELSFRASTDARGAVAWHHERMKRWDVVAGCLAALAVLALAGQFAITARPGGENVDGFTWMLLLTVATTPAVVLGIVVARRSPSNSVGALLTLLGAIPHVVSALEDWAATSGSSSPLPGAGDIAPFANSSWTLHFVGPVLLAAFFPSGRLLSSRWRALVGAVIGIPLVFTGLNLALAAGLPEGFAALPTMVLLGGLLSTLVLSVVSIALRYRRSDDTIRRQVRWLALTAVLIPGALVASWIGWWLGSSFDLVGIVLAVLLLALTGSVSVAMLRHQLYGFDRLLAGTVRWVLLLAAVALVFMLVATVLGVALGGQSAVAVAVATALAAAALVPLHQVLRSAIDRRFRPLRSRLIAAVEAFSREVQDGRAQPEELGAALDRAGAGVDIVLTNRGVPGFRARPGIGLDPADLRELESTARLPLELARLRADLRHALRQTEASRSRLVAAADDERRRIQRDLHDGAQSNLVALGMRLRELQRRAPDTADGKALDARLGEAVELVQRSITDLRELAQGVRPSSLDEGLASALRNLVKAVPLPVELSIEPLAVEDPVATAAYYVAAEAVANALKHAEPTRIILSLDRSDTGMRIAVDDDGSGGADDALGSGLAGVRDRVEAAGGRLRIRSNRASGTVIEAVFP
jgi:signal transduction histidine kinase